MHDIVIRFHYIISSLFVLMALTVVIWAIIGWVRRLQYNKVFNRLSFFFVHLLYLQLITGVILYFFLKPEPGASFMTFEEAFQQSSLRFWTIEHVSLMVFALILSQIGRLLLKELAIDWKKYRIVSIYFGISFAVVIASTMVSIIT